ncbi:MAG: hypothetical protein P8X79_22955, partial [Reinekea sp.]
GDVIAQTGEVTLGQSLMTRLGYTAPQRSWRYSENFLDVGVYQAIGLDMQGISPAQLDALQTRLNQTQIILQTADETELGSLTKHDLVGDIMQTGIQGYLAETYAMDKLSAQAADIVTYRQPSYGTFSTALEVAYFFGSPRTVNFTGVVMDVDRIKANSESKDNCYDDWLAFNRSSGMRSSAYEHIIPERLFSTDENPAEGVSTAKALSLAMAQGQKIYTLTKANQNQLANITIDDNARSEISQALSLGLEVTVHERPITVNGWQGSGYSIIDADYGVGAYKISGGSNGGVLTLENSSSILSILGYIHGFLEALNKQVNGPFDYLLAPIGRALTFVDSLISTIEMMNLDNCSVSDMQDLILLSTLFAIFMMFLAEFVLLLAFGPLFWFAYLTIVGLLLKTILQETVKYKGCSASP